MTYTCFRSLRISDTQKYFEGEEISDLEYKSLDRIIQIYHFESKEDKKPEWLKKAPYRQIYNPIHKRWGDPLIPNYEIFTFWDKVKIFIINLLP